MRRRALCSAPMQYARDPETLRHRLSESSIATLASTISDPYGTMARKHRLYGDVFPLRLPGLQPIEVVAEPKAVRELVAGTYAQMTRYGGGVELFLGRDALIFQDGEPH